MDELLVGVRDARRGLGVLRAHPRLWKWILAPAAITLLVLAALVVGVWLAVDPVLAWLAAHPTGSLGRVAGEVHGRVLVRLATPALLLLLPIAGAIAGPFHEALSEHVERALTGREPAPGPALLPGVAISLVHSARRLVAGVLGVLAVLVVGLLPTIGGVAAPLLAAWLAARAAAYDCYDAAPS
jgi:CysZ protein